MRTIKPQSACRGSIIPFGNRHNSRRLKTPMRVNFFEPGGLKRAESNVMH